MAKKASEKVEIPSEKKDELVKTQAEFNALSEEEKVQFRLNNGTVSNQ